MCVILDEADRVMHESRLLVTSWQGFYNKLDKGIGIGENKSKTSFTKDRKINLVYWISNEGFKKILAMSKEEFIESAREVVEKRMSPDDLELGYQHE